MAFKEEVRPIATSKASWEGITAVILAGGLGTRLRSVVSDRPKVLADVAGKPFLAHLLGKIESYGIRRAVICAGYKAEQLTETFGKQYGTMEVAISTEESPMGTGGALRLALSQIETDTALVMNGDSYCTADFDRFLDAHEERDEEVSLLLLHQNDCRSYGRVELDEQDRITRFEEKSTTPKSGWVNAGVYLASRNFIATIPEQQKVSIENDTFPAWIRQGIFGYRAEGDFLDIGTPERYAKAERYLLQHGTEGTV